MNEFKHILVATDTRLPEHPIVDKAAEIARNSGGKLKIVDTASEFPWTVRLTMTDHQHLHDLLVQEKAEALESLAAPLRDQGISVETKVLEGKSSVEIIREVIRNQHDLVMRVARGADSRSGSFFGNTGSRLLRQCPCSVWLVSKSTTPKFKHVLACLDTSSDDAMDAELNQRVLKLSDAISSYHDGQLSAIHTWSIWNEQMLKGRLGQEQFEEIERNTEKAVQEKFHSFIASNTEAPVSSNVIKGDPEEAITQFTQAKNVDLVVMGTVARSGIAGIVTGNSAEQILSNLQCSVLALKPSNFSSPIQVE